MSLHLIIDCIWLFMYVGYALLIFACSYLLLPIRLVRFVLSVAQIRLFRFVCL